MYWRVAICTAGVLRQICLGSDPAKIAKEQRKINKEGLENRKRIEMLFTKCNSPEKLEELLDDRSWKYDFNVSVDKFYFDEMEKIAAKYGAGGAMAGMNGYTLGVNSESDKIEILVDVPAKDYSEFHKKFGGREGAIELLYSAQRVYSAGDPAKAVLKWVKKLELEMEE